jgi:hypothetical protein
MAAGVTDRLWSVEDLVALWEAYEQRRAQLLQVINRTAHAAALSTLVETADAYRFYFGVYVRNVGLHAGLHGPD